MKRGILIILLLILLSSIVSAGLFTGVWGDYLTGRQVSENSNIIIEFENSADLSQAGCTGLQPASGGGYNCILSTDPYVYNFATFTNVPTFHLYSSTREADAIELVSKGVKTKDIWLYQKNGVTGIFYRDSDNRVSFDNKEGETLRFKHDGFSTAYTINYESSADFSQASRWETSTSEPAFILKSTKDIEIIGVTTTKQLFMHTRNDGYYKEIFYKDKDNKVRSLDIRNRDYKISFKTVYTLLTGSCTYNSINYANGVTWKIDCNSCTCSNGRPICSTMPCPVLNATKTNGTTAPTATPPTLIGPPASEEDKTAPTPCPSIPTVDSCPKGEEKYVVFSSADCGVYYACRTATAPTATPPTLIGPPASEEDKTTPTIPEYIGPPICALIGDVNNDGKITQIDVSCIRDKSIQKPTLKCPNIDLCGDLNGDGIITAIDVRLASNLAQPNLWQIFSNLLGKLFSK